MLKKLFLVSTLLMFMMGVSSALAAECVDVDIELTSEVIAEHAEILHGSVELVNCGDEADLIGLAVTVDLGFGGPFTLGTFYIPLAAGETASREFRLAAPPVPEEVTLEICITATSGASEATDCASATFGGLPNGTGEIDKIFFSMASASTSDCVELDFEITDTITTTPGDFFATGFYEIVNCGDTASLVFLQTTIEILPTVPISAFSTWLPAGESVSREFTFPIPPAVSEGEYAFTVTATSGEASVSVTEIVVVLDGSPGGAQGTKDPSSTKLRTSNYPNPFNPSTTISYVLPNVSHVTLKVYNVLGKEINTLVNDVRSAGEHNVVWDGTDNNGNQVSSGMYFYRIVTDKKSMSKKMLLVK